VVISSVNACKALPIAPVGGGLPSSTLKTRVQNYLNERMMIGASCVVEDPVYVPAEVTLTVYVLPSFGQASVRTNVRNAIAALFDFTTVSFGSRISIGDVFRAAMDVQGVDYINLTVLRKIGDATAVQDIVPTPIQLPQLLDANLTVTAVGGLT